MDAVRGAPAQPGDDPAGEAVEEALRTGAERPVREPADDEPGGGG